MVWFKNFNLLSYELLSQCSALQSLLSWALSFYFLHSELPWQQLPLILSFSLLIIRRVSFWLLKFSPFYLKTLIYLISNIHLPSVQISFETPAAWGERARAGARVRASACAHARARMRVRATVLRCLICSITHPFPFLVSYCSVAGARKNKSTKPF